MAETRSRVLVLQGVTRAVRSDDEREKLYCHVVLLDTINERTDRKSHHCVPHHEACSDCIIQLHIQHPSRYSNVNARTYSIYIHICIPMHKDVIAKDALVAQMSGEVVFFTIETRALRKGGSLPVRAEINFPSRRLSRHFFERCDLRVTEHAFLLLSYFLRVQSESSSFLFRKIQEVSENSRQNIYYIHLLSFLSLEYCIFGILLK